MRVLRILLRNYRGVEDCEVHFAPHGVTVVEGPNESGKTSLAEALRVVLNEKENSTKKNVRDLKRTDRDLPTEVEVEIETGPYRFTLRKAFNKRSRAELQVHAPRPENLTGGEVHSRVREILEETVDMRLLDALWVQQGAKVEQTSLAGCTSLGEALDRAAGTVPAGDREETLFERATAEYRRYWTPRGGQARELVASSRRVDELRQHVDAAVEEERRLDTFIKASERLQREVADLALEQEGAASKAASARDRLAEVEQAEVALSGVEARVTTNAVQRDAAVKALEGRRVLIDDLQQAEDELAQSTADLQAFDQRLAPLREQSDDAAARRDNARAALAEARALFDRRKADRQHTDDLVHLQMLHERIGRVDQLTADAATAQAIVDRVQLTDKAIASVREQAVQHRTELTRRDALSASATIEPHEAIDVTVDGASTTVAIGARFERIVSTATRFDIGTVATLTVGPGIGVDEQNRHVAEADRALQESLQAVGAATLEEAESLYEQRVEATRTLQAASTRLKDDLRDLTLEQLRQSATRVKASTDDYLASRPLEPALAGDINELRVLEDEARAQFEHLNEDYPPLEAAATAQEAEHKRVLAERVGLDAACQAATTNAGRLAAQLAREREGSSDDELQSQAADFGRAYDAASAVLRSAQLELDRRDPATTRLFAGNAEQVVADIRAQLGTRRNDLATAEASIAALSPAGLFSRREAVEIEHQEACEEDARLRQRAAAAKLLLDTLTDERTRAQRAYVEPLQREIERRGHAVFGPDFEVRIDEAALAVTDRRLNNIWVAWDQLSVGAQEQLGIITRLAAATLVSADGGAPLIIDDALGHSDDERLDAMCAVLAAAGPSMQIIALTCMPTRYRRIGGATTVSMLDSRVKIAS